LLAVAIPALGLTRRRMPKAGTDKVAPVLKDLLAPRQ
jgi:hypothetical protein